MIPQRIQTYLTLFLTLLVFSSCQKKSVVISKKAKTETEVRPLITTADQFKTNKQLDSAFFYYNKAKINCNPAVHSNDYAYCVMNMAEIQQTLGDYLGSETTITKALPLLKNLKNPDSLWKIYTILGTSYSNIYNYDDALSYFYKALHLKTDFIKKLATKNNIGAVLIKQKKYDAALQILVPLSITKTTLENREYYSKILDNIGFCHFKLGKDDALLYYTKSLELKSEINDSYQLSKIYYHLAEYYQKRNLPLSIKYAQLSYAKYSASDCTDNTLKALAFLIKNDSGKELEQNAITYVTLTDSISEIKQKAKNLFARIKYDSKKEKDENLKLKVEKIKNELQLEEQETKNNISYIIILLTLVLILILYFYLSSRTNREKLKATYHSETRISKKLHDELANDVYHAMAFAENRDLSITENRNNLINNLTDIYSRTTDISKEDCPILTDINYIFSLKNMISGFNTSNVTLVLNGLDTILWDEIDKTTKIAIYRILQELLVNMKKHSKATLIDITIKKTADTILINYGDNGQGIDLKKIGFKNGLQNIENRISTVKGSVTFNSNPKEGFKVFIKLPLHH
ncbi:tetratricopeptide repeat-containing sensor histidine kinase [Flavobacterium poyangense]|uniref:tetratricopeptide repeat-containing sensor histidine kinase n=1 Tax=Flavobacterium poyangense TaxID=2204302 RepID=UPI001FBB5E32|nr:ATP-binding protein [Flavobacterium sp. JXAS1]